MKKIMFLAVFAIIALAVSAQSVGGGRNSSGNTFFSTEKAEKGVTIGIRGGLNVSGFSADVWESDGLSFKNAIGYNAGINIDIPIIRSMYIQTGAYWTVKNVKLENDMHRPDKFSSGKINSMFIEIPLLASYRYDITDNMQFQVNIGPYFAYGIAGKTKEGANMFTSTNDYQYKYEKTLKPFDIGVKVGAGVTFKKIYLGVSYEHGLVNIANYNISGNQYSYSYCNTYGISKIKTHSFSVNIGYDF